MKIQTKRKKRRRGQENLDKKASVKVQEPSTRIS
jgi:hypothetical protein